MANYPQAAGAPIEKSSGITRLQNELAEIAQRIIQVSISINNAGEALYGPRPQEAAEESPSANTVDSRLNDIRRALAHLEDNTARLHQS